ncbi:MAG: hypothetical protein DRP74_09250 [Candidatus Omnitrophota bacterium]|nr:MAG: hypothetical protein DRP74_09250 [Candidatus Omnitrophota bacterium]
MFRILNQIYTWKELEKKYTGVKLSEMHEEEKSKAKVRSAMTKEVLTIGEDATLDDVMSIMFTKKIHTTPVVKDDKLIGIVGKRDLIYSCF